MFVLKDAAYTDFVCTNNFYEIIFLAFFFVFEIDCSPARIQLIEF